MLSQINRKEMIITGIIEIIDRIEIIRITDKIEIIGRIITIIIN